jgi:hypothetical protein
VIAGKENHVEILKISMICNSQQKTTSDVHQHSLAQVESTGGMRQKLADSTFSHSPSKLPQ